MSELINKYVIDFSSRDGVSNTIKKIDNELETVRKKAESTGKSIDAAFEERVVDIKFKAESLEEGIRYVDQLEAKIQKAREALEKADAKRYTRGLSKEEEAKYERTATLLHEFETEYKEEKAALEKLKAEFQTQATNVLDPLEIERMRDNILDLYSQIQAASDAAGASFDVSEVKSRGEEVKDIIELLKEDIKEYQEAIGDNPEGSIFGPDAVAEVEEVESKAQEAMDSIKQRAEELKTSITKEISEIKREMEAMLKQEAEGGSFDESRYAQLADRLKELQEITGKVKSDTSNNEKGFADKYLKKIGLSDGQVKALNKNARSVISTLGEKGGLSKVLKGFGSSILKGAKGGIAGLAVALGSQALKLGAQAAQKAIEGLVNKLVSAIKNIGEFKRAMRGAMEVSAGNATKELNELDNLNNRLKAATKGSQEWCNVRDEIVKKFGQYDKNLAAEILRTGNLTSSYKQLAQAILESSMARQADKLIEERATKRGGQVGAISKNAYKKFVRKYGREEGAAKYRDWSSTVMTSEEQVDVATGKAARIRRKLQKLSKETADINNYMGVGVSSQANQEIDYSAYNELLEKEAQFADQQYAADKVIADMKERGTQLVISAMSDGASKQYAQAEANYNAAIAQMKDQERGYRKQAEALAKATYIASGGSEQTWKKGSTDFIFGMGIDEMKAYKVQLERLKDTAQITAQGLAQLGTINFWLPLQEQFEEMQKAQDKARRQQEAQIAFQTSQSNAQNYGNAEQKRAAINAKWDREIRTQTQKQYKERMEAQRKLELATLEYDMAQQGNSQDAIRKALEKKLAAEIKTLDEAVRPAAEARNRVTLAEFDLKNAEMYLGRAGIRSALEASLNEELNTIEASYKPIKEAMNKVRLAEFDVETYAKYGNRTQRRLAQQELLRAQAAEYVAKNGGGDRALIDKQNAYDMALFDYEEIADYGSYEAVLAALKKKWNAFIETLPDDLKKGAIKKMNAEIAEFQFNNEEGLKKIFANTDGYSKEMLDELITYAEKRLEVMANAGDASIEKIAELRERIDSLKQESDNFLSRGWGGSIEGLIANRAKKKRSEEKITSLIGQEGAAILNGDVEGLHKLGEEVDNEIGKINQLNKEAKQMLSVMGAKGLASALTEVGDAFSQLGENSLGESLSSLGSFVDSVASGFASGGPIGGAIAAATSLLSMTVKGWKESELAEKKTTEALKEYRRELTHLKEESSISKLSNAFGTDSMAAFQKSYEYMTKYTDKISEVLQKNGLVFSTFEKNSFFKGTIGNTYTNFDRIENFDGDELKLWYDKLSDKQKENLGEQKDIIEELLDYWDEYKECLKEVTEFVSNLTGNIADSLSDKMIENFINTGSAIADMTDYLNSFNRTLAQSIVKSMLMKEVFTKEAQDEISKLLATGDTTGAIDAYNKLLGQANAMAPEIENFLSSLNVDWTTQRSSANTGIASMSQDSANELNGRFTTIQTHTFDIRAGVQALQAQNELLVQNSGLILLEVQGIHGDTANISSRLEGVENAVGSMRTSMNYIMTNGLKMLS